MVRLLRLLRLNSMLKTFTYWYAEHLDDHQCYSIVTRTKAEAVKQRNQDPECFGPVEKRTITYDSLFDFFEIVTGEGGGRGSGST
jgi:hypothetical protein